MHHTRLSPPHPWERNRMKSWNFIKLVFFRKPAVKKIAPAEESERRRRGKGKKFRVRIRRDDEETPMCVCVRYGPYACVSCGIRFARGAVMGKREREWEREEGRKGRNTCTAATQQFRVRCYVSESVMPMWAEANLWSPVSARTCVAFVYVRGTRNSRVYKTYAGTYRRLRSPRDPSPPWPRW